MKRLLLACCFALFFATPGFTQNVVNNPNEIKTNVLQNYDKRLFDSKITELSAYASRNATDYVKKTMNELTELMKNSIEKTKESIKADKVSSQKEQLFIHEKKLEIQQDLFSSIERSFRDPSKFIRNHKDAIQQLRMFQETI